MADNETTADIIAEMRDEAARADMEQDYSLDDAAEMMREFAWRLEAAHKRERGDMAKLREACANIAEYARSAMCHATDAHLLGYLNQIEGWSKAALAAPPRNCDRFATADEAIGAYRQTHRYMVVNVFLDWLFAPAQEGGAK